MFTNDDNPASGNAELRKKCLEKAKDLIASDIVIELFVLKKKDDTFNSGVFWEHMIGKSEDTYEGSIVFDYVEKVKELREKVRKKMFRKRGLGNLDVQIGDNLSFSVTL